eukprot:437319-Pleurochrysis_carterae.AAC.1
MLAKVQARSARNAMPGAAGVTQAPSESVVQTHHRARQSTDGVVTGSLTAGAAVENLDVASATGGHVGRIVGFVIIVVEIVADVSPLLLRVVGEHLCAALAHEHRVGDKERVVAPLVAQLLLDQLLKADGHVEHHARTHDRLRLAVQLEQRLAKLNALTGATAGRAEREGVGSCTSTE